MSAEEGDVPVSTLAQVRVSIAHLSPKAHENEKKAVRPARNFTSHLDKLRAHLLVGIARPRTVEENASETRETAASRSDENIMDFNSGDVTRPAQGAGVCDSRVFIRTAPSTDGTAFRAVGLGGYS